MTSFDGDKKVKTTDVFIEEIQFGESKRDKPEAAASAETGGAAVVITMASRGRNIRKKSLMLWTMRSNFICAVLWTSPF